MKKTIIIILIVVLVGVGIYYSRSSSPSAPLVDNSQTSQTQTETKAELPGMQKGTYPWIAEISNLKARLDAIGLPALTAEGTALHTHQHLDIFIDGQTADIPAGIGINETARFISDIHVHDDTGIIHVESPTIQTFTLGQFFDIWGVSFSGTNIGGYSNQDEKTLKIFVNGKPYAGDPRMLSLEPHQEIVIAYGTEKELPNPIPSSYVFPAGY